jgi:hypothetical protein
MGGWTLGTADSKQEASFRLFSSKKNLDNVEKEGQRKSYKLGYGKQKVGCNLRLPFQQLGCHLFARIFQFAQGNPHRQSVQQKHPPMNPWHPSPATDYWLLLGWMANPSLNLFFY